MNQIVMASAGILLAITLVFTGKNPAKLLSKLKKNEKTSLSVIENISLISSAKKIHNTSFNKAKADPLNKKWTRPTSIQEQISLNKKLLQEISLGPEERLQAIKIACLWGHQCTIDILKRGLKDSDFRVVISAAAGMQKFKCNSPVKKLNQVSVRPPRNVSLMR
tara:strand:- start:33 stop:524 length:492 start_codon:yes stop_codon:yes gene_type:complete